LFRKCFAVSGPVEVVVAIVDVVVVVLAHRGKLVLNVAYVECPASFDMNAEIKNKKLKFYFVIL
jgi:hypothetical protein